MHTLGRTDVPSITLMPPGAPVIVKAAGQLHGEVVEAERVLVEPASVGKPRRDFAFDVVVFEQATFGGVDILINNASAIDLRGIDQLDMKVPVYIENTAGGANAMARRLESLKYLWDAVGDSGVGFCLDTCHAHAGGIPMTGLADTVLGITGRIDLVHCNDSRDAFDSGADRHANLGNGHIAADDIINCIRTAKAPVILETPGEGVSADLAFLAAKLG